MNASLARMRILFRAFHLDRRSGRVDRSRGAPLTTDGGVESEPPVRVDRQRIEERRAAIRDSPT
jgi:hypothetical protein